jgi:hypothetical protein
MKYCAQFHSHHYGSIVFIGEDQGFLFASSGLLSLGITTYTFWAKRGAHQAEAILKSDVWDLYYGNIKCRMFAWL